MTEPEKKEELPRVDIGESTWHFDKRIPVAMIVSMAIFFFGQSATALWWASTMSARVEHLERQLTISAPNADRLTRLEVKVETVQSGIAEIKDILRQPLPTRNDRMK